MEESAPNRYQPPKAPVADISPAGDATPIPMITNIGVGVLWLGFTLDLIGTAVQIPSIIRMGQSYGSVFLYVALTVVIVLTLLVAGLIHLISRGRQWARIVYLVIFLIGLPLVVIGIAETLESSVATGVGALIKLAIQAVAFLLLFLPKSNAWFRSRRVTA